MPTAFPESIAKQIRVLPANVVNQIAAGEVVERPASVVKELVENALDAGATQVTVEIERGGIELIRVSDNGSGIPQDELALAIHPHATSKITSPADLDRIATMGFRGEALASIASVSRFSIRSRAAGEPGASLIEVEGGEQRPARPEAGPAGTTVGVRNLFFNTPARRKFLRTPQTEQGHCVDIVRNIAMSHPAIGFAFKADGRTVLDLASGQSPRERAMGVIGREMESEYLEVHADRFDDTRGLALWGLAGKPHLARPGATRQHVFVNGRPIRDRTIMHALREAYRGLIEPGRHPAAMLMIEMDPSAVDVNVHPAKAEVRFRDSGLVHRVVQQAVREALRSAELTPEAPAGSGFRFEQVGARSAEAVEGVGKRFTDYFQRLVPQGKDQKIDFDAIRKAVEQEKQQIEAAAREVAEEKSRVEEARAQILSTDHLRASRRDDAAGQSAMDAVRPALRHLKVHNSFLVTQDEQGVVIVDQHALHERVMFEKLKERMEAGTLESQRLLMPGVVEASPKQMDLLEQMQELLAQLGIGAEPIGPQSIAIHGFPSLLFEKGVDPSEFMTELLEKTEAEGLADSREAALAEVLDMMACKAAVKAGDSLSESEVEELLAMRERIERSSNCPHGRPTAIRLSIRELERQFGRG